MFKKLKAGFKKHNKVYSLGLLVVATIVVSFLYAKVDELETDMLTGWMRGRSQVSRSPAMAAQIYKPRIGQSFRSGDEIDIQWRDPCQSMASCRNQSRFLYDIKLVPPKGEYFEIAKDVMFRRYKWTIPRGIDGKFKIVVTRQEAVGQDGRKISMVDYFTIYGSGPGMSNGEFITAVYNHWLSASCNSNLCADMGDYRPDEVARCNLQAKGIYDPPMPDDDWYATKMTYYYAPYILNTLFDLELMGSVGPRTVQPEWLDQQLIQVDVEKLCQAPAGSLEVVKSAIPAS